jgi:hypothetical protein
MSHREFVSPPVRVPSIYLDHGIDETRDGAVTVSERGMMFRSRWRFQIGTQLGVVCQWMHPRLGAQRTRLEGTVVWCARRGPADYETTLLFLELPDDAKASLREFSRRHLACV